MNKCENETEKHCILKDPKEERCQNNCCKYCNGVIEMTCTFGCTIAMESLYPSEE